MQIRSVNRSSKSLSFTIPAPIKGLNRRDNEADMALAYALVIDNYMPQDSKVVLRKGYVKYADINGAVKTIASYDAGAFSQLLAVSVNKMYNLTDKNNVRILLDSGISNDCMITAQYKNRLYLVNGVDVPKVYYIDEQNQEHIGDWEFTANGLQERQICNVGISKQRLWFVEKNSLKVWYPQTAGSISGELDCFDLTQICRFGGSLYAVAAWTQDGGQGIDDLTVFITSEGEVLVYSGSDISNADDWKLRGSYKISRPLCRQCLIQYQGDLVVISEDGYIPLSKSLPLDKANSSQVAFSDAIRGLVLDRTQHYASYFGWQGIIYSRGGYALFNVPVANNFEQHIINLNTGAWCRFTQIRSYCWGQFDKRLYFGTDGGVCLFDEGYSDNGAAICGEIRQAYTNLGTERLKKIQMLNPRTKSISPYNLVVYTNMDMEEQNVDYAENIGYSGQTKWNEVKWSSPQNPSGTFWQSSGKSVLRSQWIANSAVGYKASLVLKTKTSGNSIEFYETIVRYETGEGIL